jgi:hypothetical protein
MPSSIARPARADAALADVPRLTLTVLCLALIATGIGLRFSGLQFGRGVPQARPDEPGVIATLRAIEDGELHPMHLAYGGGYHYPLYAFVNGWARLAWSDSLGTAVGIDPHRVEVAARFYSALLSTLAVWLTFSAGSRIGGSTTGLLAAALLACCSLAIREAHFAKADSAASCGAALVVRAFCQPDSRSRRLRSLAIGAAAGIALSTKYLVGLMPAVLLALATDTGGRKLSWHLDRRSVLVALQTAAVVTLALNPFWITHATLAWRYARLVAASQFHFTRQPWLVAYAVAPLVYHARVSLWLGCGRLFTALVLPALAFGLWHSRSTRLISISVIGSWATLLANPLVLARNLLPSIPGLCVLIAVLVVEAAARLTRDSPASRRLVALAALLVVVEPLRESVALVNLLGRDDTRTLAREWIDVHLPERVPVVSWGAPPRAGDFGLPPLGSRDVTKHLPVRRWASAGAGFLVWHHYPIPYSSETLPTELRDAKPLVVFDPFAEGGAPGAVFEPLDAFYLPIAGFSGVERPGPRIEIFDIRGAVS